MQRRLHNRVSLNLFIHSFFISILIEFALSSYAAGAFPDMIFTAAVDLVIFGKDLFLAVSFNLRDPIGSLRATSDKSTDWYKDKMNTKDASDTEKNYYDDPNPFADFEMSGMCVLNSQMSPQTPEFTSK